MPAQEGGSVGIEVLPKIDSAAWGRQIQAKLDPTLERVGRTSGRKLGAALSDGAKAGFSVRRLEEALKESTPRMQAAATTLGRKVGAEIARAAKAELEGKLKNLPRATVKVKVELDEASVERVRQRIERLGPFRVTINVDADTAAALAKLALLRAEADRMFSRSVNVNVGANTAQASSALLMLGLQMAALASIPLGATLAAGIGGIAAAATAAGAGIGGILAVAIPAVHHITEALQAQKTADNQVATSTKGRATALNTAAIATLQARLQAQQMAQAERQVTQAQQAARQAQRDLNQARVDGARALQDMQNNLIDAGLSMRGDELAVLRAKQALDQLNSSRDDSLAAQKAQLDLTKAQGSQKLVLADPKSTQLQKDQAKLAVDTAAEALRQAKAQLAAHELERKEAQLAYQQAVQQLKEQRLAYKRLADDEGKARKAGVEGTQQVVDAKERLKSALQQVADAQRTVRQQQIQDKIAALQQADAQRQAASAADGASAANVRLGRAMDKLTPAENNLLNAFDAVRKSYRSWVNELEPDVLPVLADGLGLAAQQLTKFSPLVRSSAAALHILEMRAKVALDGPFWTNFINNLSIAAPEAILRFGGIAGNTLHGVAGIFNAFLPYTNLLLGAVEQLTQRFARWGESLGGSDGFISFIQYVERTGPMVIHTLGSIGSAFVSLARALAPLAGAELAAITHLASAVASFADTHPELVQLAVALLLVSKAVRVLGVTSLVSGFRGTAGAAGAASGAMVGLGARLRALGAAMMGVSAQTVTTRTALMGLGRAAGFLLAFYAATQAINHFSGSAKDAKPSTDALKQSLTQLANTGQASGPLLKQFSDGLGDMNEQAKLLTAPSSSESWANWSSSVVNGLLRQKGIAGEARDNYDKLDRALVSLTSSGQADVAKAAFDRLSKSLQDNGRNVNQVNSLFPTYTRLMFAGGGSAALFTAQIQRQNQTLSQNAQKFIDDEQEVIDFNQAVNAGKDALNRNGAAFRGNSAAATDNRQQIINAARVLKDYSDNLVKNNQLTDGNIKKLRGQREQLIQVAERFTGSRKAAEDYIDKLFKIPKKVTSNLTVNASGKFKLKGLEGLAKDPFFSGIIPHAGGGVIGGGGGPRTDGHLTRISTGEMVVNAPATSRYLPLLTAINDEGNAGTIYKGKGYTSLPIAPSSPPAAGPAYAGGGLAVPASPERMPAFAGGGIFAPSYNSSYKYSGASEATINKATRGLARNVVGMTAYSAGQTVAAATLLSSILEGGYGQGGKAVSFAKAQLGEPYVWGATGPDTWDCSGLTQAAWKYAGVQIPRVTYDQIAFGTPTTKAHKMPGDLYFPDVGHVMMVTGMGGDHALIHAPHTGDHVRYASQRAGGVFRHIAGGGGSNYGGGHPKDFAKAQLGELGWSSGQYSPLNKLWTRESGWRWNAQNPSSGAYGIPQALPGSKMASFGSDWRTNWATQIRWGLDYIKHRYGSPSGAWGHSQRTGWYAAGTDNARRGLAWVGEDGPELVDFRGGEAVHNHADSARIAAAASAAPLELADVGAGGGDTHLHAHFDGTTRASVQHEVKTAFTAMQIGQAQSQRFGRPK